MEIKAISDAAPIIHLSEIEETACFPLFSTVFVTHEVYREVKACNLPGNDEVESKVFEIVEIKSNKKDRVEYYSQKYDVSITDATVIALVSSKA